MWPSGQGERFLTSRSRVRIPPCPLPSVACMATFANPTGSLSPAVPASPHFVRLARTVTLAAPGALLSPAMPVHCEARAERAPRGGERRAKRAVNERSEATSEPERDSNHARRAKRVSPRVRMPRDASGVSRPSRSRWLRSVPPCPLRLTSFGSHARRPSQRPGRCSVPPCPLPLIACMATLANPAGSLSPAMPVHCEARAERAPRGGEREERSDERTGTGFKLRETSGVSLAGRPNVPPSRSSNGERDAGRDELLLAAAELRAWNDRPRTTSRRSPGDGSG